MSSPPLTEEQLAAVERRDGDLLLAAAAGSGKTSVMVERFVRSVREDGIAVGQLLAITFTEKAASELKERIRARFLALGEEGHAREAESGAIGTIHGLCARLLRADPLRAGLDPRFAVLDAPEAERLARGAFAQALEDFLSDGGEPASALVAAYGAERLRATVLDAHEALRSRGEAPELPPLGERPDPAMLRPGLEAAARELAAELGPGPEGKTVARALAALEACGAGLAATVTREDVPLPASLASSRLPKGNGHALATPACERYRAAQAAHADACRDHHAGRAYALIGALLAAHAARYAEEKEARSALDFSDLELGALALLRAHPDVREREAARCARIMVDEFQDTNPLQLELLGLLSRSNLFTVGDEFQSIYGFRHADVELFRSRRAELEPVGATATLRRNFRARGEILHALNAAFAPVLGERFAPLVRGREDPPDPLEGPPRVELLLTDSDAAWDPADFAAPGEPPPAPLWRAAEARLLAQRVRELVDRGEHGLGEIVVLLRATGDLALFSDALEEAGVPTYVIGGRGYWAHREVQDLVAHLAVLANPHEEERLHEVLASPLVGLSSDGLVLVSAAARAARSYPWRALRAAFAPEEAGTPAPIPGLPEEDRARLARAVPWILEERAAAPYRSLEALIDRALVRGGFDLALLRAPGGPRRLANVRKLMRLAREWEAREGRDLRGFLDAVAERAGEELELSRESEAPVEGENLDAVRLMTIHRAKGLEFEVVCVADLGRRAPGGGQELLRLGEDGRVGLRLVTLDGTRSVTALDWDDVGAVADRAAAEEERRLFYVAMTRARERLVLSGGVSFARWPPPGRTCPPLAWIAPAFVGELAPLIGADARARGVAVHPADPSVRVAWTVNTPETIGSVLGARPELSPDAPADRLPTRAEEEILLTRPGAPPPAGSPAPLSFSSLQRHARCGYRFYLEEVLLLPRGEEETTGEEGERALGATTRGSIVHGLLERMRFGSSARPSPEALASVCAELGARPSGEEQEEILELVQAFGSSPLAARLARCAEPRREERFAFVLDREGRDPALVVGAFDVLAWEGERLLLVDYKTNRLEGRRPAEIVEAGYAVQRLVYALAALRAGAREVEVAFAFLERPEEPVRRTFSSAEEPALAVELARHARAVRAGRFPVSDAPGPELCGGCPGRGTLCSHPLVATERRATSPRVTV